MQEQVDQQWSERRFVVIDFETTGIDAANDRVVEMGVAVFEQGELVVAQGWLVNPGIPVPEEASKVHGITNEMLADAPPFVQAIVAAMPLLVGAVPCAYNAPFDKEFLLAEVARTGLPAIEGVPALDPSHPWIDPLIWVRELQKYEKGKKLTDAARRLRIELTSAHRASADAEAAGRVLMAYASRMPSTHEEILDMQTRLGKEHDEQYRAWRERNAERAQ